MNDEGIQSQSHTEWATDVESGLKVWYKLVPGNPYKGRKGFLIELCSRMGIDERYVSSIVNSVGYATGILGEDGDKRNVYAALYLLGISQADPTTIPPFINKLPNGTLFRVDRAWTKENYEEWRSGRQAKKVIEFGKELRISKRKAQPRAIQSGSSVPTVQSVVPQQAVVTAIAQPSFGSMLDTLIAQLGAAAATSIATQLPTAEAVADLVVAKLQQEQQHPAHTIDEQRLSENIADAVSQQLALFMDQGGVGQLATALHNALSEYAKASDVSRRDELMRRYGRQLARLSILLNTLTSDRDSRERAIQMGKDNIR